MCRYDSAVKELVRIAKAFSDTSRVRILMALRERELCVCELCDALTATQSTLSTHLTVIRNAGLVSARKQGKWMYYTIATDARRLLRNWFETFSDSLRTDAILRQDAQRLARRLELRDNGSCCIGFGGTKGSCNSTRK
jgi:DNA-binding transcriptional ArsR family regulator